MSWILRVKIYGIGVAGDARETGRGSLPEVARSGTYNVRIMRMSKGVEWAIHTLLNLDVIGGGPVGSGQLADAHGLPAPYLNKQLQQLAKAGLLASTPGPRGGFRLAK